MTESPDDFLTQPAPRVLRKEFSVTLGEAVQSQKLLMSQRMSSRFPYSLAVVAWAFTSTVSYAMNGEMDYRVLVAMLVNLPVPLLVLGFFKWLPQIAWRSHYRTHFGPGPYSSAVEIADRQLVSVFDDLEIRFAWHAVRKLENHPDEFRIFVAKIGLVRIPTHVFSSENERREWMDVLEQKTGLSFS